MPIKGGKIGVQKSGLPSTISSILIQQLSVIAISVLNIRQFSCCITLEKHKIRIKLQFTMI